MGFGVVEDRRGTLVHVDHGVIRADPGAPLEVRLKEIFAELSSCVRLHRPDAVAVEGLFTFRNARSALVLGHARGVALLAAAQENLPVHEYSPARVKKSVGAGGNDGKDAVARMVKTFLGLSGFERADASDALAVAICHLNQARLSIGGPSRLPKPSRASKAKLGLFAERLRPAYQRFGTGR